jgi:hypothetical protein
MKSKVMKGMGIIYCGPRHNLVVSGVNLLKNLDLTHYKRNS